MKSLQQILDEANEALRRWDAYGEWVPLGTFTLMRDRLMSLRQLHKDAEAYLSKLGDEHQAKIAAERMLDCLIADRDQWKGWAEQLQEERDTLESRLAAGGNLYAIECERANTAERRLGSIAVLLSNSNPNDWNQLVNDLNDIVLGRR